MREDAILAVDLGTSGCRAELLSLRGHCLGRHCVEYGVLSPLPGAAEQAAAEWWEAIVTCTRQAVAQAGAQSPSVAAIGISAQGHSWVPVDANLRPLRPALTWLDARAAGVAASLLRDHPLRFWGERTGKQPGQWHLLPQWLWLKKTEPETIARTRYALFAHDYLFAHLTGERVTDYTTAAGSLLFDLASWDWSPELLAEYAFPPEALSRLAPAGALAGRLHPAAAEALGLPAGLPVAVGAQDQKCAALAAGLGPGTATASLGTSTAVIAPVPYPSFSPEHGSIPCFPYLRHGQYVLEAPLATSGGALRWLRDLLGAGSGYEALVGAAETLEPGADGVLFYPYFAGAGAPHWRAEARGAVTGLTLQTGPGHLVRALMEAVAYDLRANLEHMRAQGCHLERLILFGGGARSALWPRLIASVCGLETLASTETEAAVRGAAMLASQVIAADPEVFRLPSEPVEQPPGWAAAYCPLSEAYASSLPRYWDYTRSMGTP